MLDYNKYKASDLKGHDHEFCLHYLLLQHFNRIFLIATKTLMSVVKLYGRYSALILWYINKELAIVIFIYLILIAS